MYTCQMYPSSTFYYSLATPNPIELPRVIRRTMLALYKKAMRHTHPHCEIHQKFGQQKTRLFRAGLISQGAGSVMRLC
jgi:hypothetical protein